MMKRALAGTRGRLTYANVVSTIALFLALSGGVVYAATQIGSNDIKKNAVKSKHIKANAVKAAEIADGAVTGAEIADGAVTAAELANNAVGSGQLADGAVTRNKLDSDSQARWGVFNNSGDLNRGKGVVSSASIGTAVYEVTFDRDVSQCAWNATIARQAAAAPEPGEIGVRPLDTNPRSVIVHTFDSAGTPADNRFHLLVMC